MLKYWVDDTDDGDTYCVVQRRLDVDKLRAGSVVYVEVWNDNAPLSDGWVEIEGGSSAEDVLQAAGQEALSLAKRLLRKGQEA
jgi:hypothetical protein